MNSINVLNSYYGADGAAQILTCARASVFRALKRNGKINPRPKARFYPVWFYVDPDWLYKTINYLSSDFGERWVLDKEDLKDFLLNFAYKVKLGGKRNPKSYLYVALQRKCMDYLHQKRLFDEPLEVIERWERGHTEKVVPLKR